MAGQITLSQQMVGITPAMPTGSSLKYMMELIPERAYDVGIAEQHAVTLAAGMATQGLIPFCNIYSTFLQRAYDQVIHDVALQNLPVIFCLDRSGLVGEDGATHHGVFDITFLRCIPNLIIFAPRNEIDLRNIMFTAQLGLNKPIVIRYPRGKGTTTDWEQPFQKLTIGKGAQLKKGTQLAILSVGTIAENIIRATLNLNVSHYDLKFIKPLDATLLHMIFREYKHLMTVEDNCVKGGFGSAILEFASEHNYKNDIKVLGVPDTFMQQGTIVQLQEQIGLDSASIRNTINKILNTTT